MTSRTVVLVTFAAKPHATDDDQLLVDVLRKRGFTVQATPWDDPRMDWASAGLVVLRSCWDYHRRLPEFLDWLTRLERESVHVINPLPVVRWNLDKHYLAELAQAGITIVPTEWVDGDAAIIAATIRTNSWTRAVVKPAISASAFGTFLFEEGRPFGEGMPPSGRYLVQPFVDEIVTAGEWSIIFFNGEYSHSVLKRPREGDFRVQSELGGSATPATPPAAAIEAARRALVAGTSQSTYARVDGVVIENQFTLMELELIEPVLFLHEDSDAPERFAGAIERSIEG